MMTPDPDPDWVTEGLAGMPRVRMLTTEGRIFVTTAGTDNVLSDESTGRPPGLAQVNEVMTRLRDKIEKAKERSARNGVPRTIGLILRNRPYFRTTCSEEKATAQNTTG